MLVAEIEPVVDHAILRCLEKDPARRPASAAQLAGSLPGGDPLAAAIAAGETPSPELVAASGEEGTLPRKQAWMWFLVCLAVLALSVPLGSLWQLANVVPVKEPAVQKAAARDLLNSIGYRNLPADSASWFAADTASLASLVRTRPPGEWFRDPAAKRRLIVFCYRESPTPLFSWHALGLVGAVDSPAFRYPDDAFLQLDAGGRLVFLRGGGLELRSAEALTPRPANWSLLFTAAGLDAAALKEATIEWPAVVTADESRAWLGQADEGAVRVEGSAYRGRPVQFLIAPTERKPPAGPPVRTKVAEFLQQFAAVTTLVCLGVVAVLARHNLRAGRGDRRGAFRLAVVIVAVETIYVLFERHWTFRPSNVVSVLTFFLGGPFFTGIEAWLFYMGTEPFLRRRWPHLLTAWTRLLDGRWRDPLVGRSLLAGTGTALLALPIVPGILSALTRVFSLPLAVPRYVSGTLDGGLLWFLIPATTNWVGPVHMLLLVAVLLVARLVLRRDWLAWTALFLVTFGLHMWDLLLAPGAMAAPLGSVIIATAVSLGLVGVTMREGVLAGAACYTVLIAAYMTPFTHDLTRWYAWRTVVVVALIATLAYGGFRNVLGRQSPFPESVLDA